MQIERRESQRYPVKENAYAVINPDPLKVVPILDVGAGGLGIYVDDNGKLPDTSSKLEILVADCSFHLENLPFEIILSRRALPAGTSNLLAGQRCSLKFGSLMPRQKSQLKYFIRNYTEGNIALQIMQKFSKLFQPIWANQYSAKSCTPGIWQGLQHPTR